MLCEEEWILLPERAVLWPDQKMLIISDLHLGKILHFRKAGIGVPASARFNNYERLQDLFLAYEPERVLFLGDLFHSEWNREWEEFVHFLKMFDATEAHLVVGNHDILDPAKYIEVGIIVHERSHDLGPFHFTHAPEECHDRYNVCGHIHPAIRLRGKGRQTERLSCFYFDHKRAILPAFGVFTGMHLVNHEIAKNIYAIADSRIIKII